MLELPKETAVTMCVGKDSSLSVGTFQIEESILRSKQASSLIFFLNFFYFFSMVLEACTCSQSQVVLGMYFFRKVSFDSMIGCVENFFETQKKTKRGKRKKKNLVDRMDFDPELLSSLFQQPTLTPEAKKDGYIDLSKRVIVFALFCVVARYAVPIVCDKVVTKGTSR